MDEEAEGERELGLALLKFVMESSVLGRRDGDGELGILPVSLPFAALIESSPFSPPSLSGLGRSRLTDRGGGKRESRFFALLPHTRTARWRRRGEKGEKEGHTTLQ